MAQKRMFDKAVIDTDRFMDLPMTTKAMYFLLGMEADDEGFVSHKKVQRIHGGSEDDVRVLAAKEFVILFPSGVAVITDWHKNNWLDSRRSRTTEYVTEKNLLELNEDKEYVLSNRLAKAKPVERSTEEYRGVESKNMSASADLQACDMPVENKEVHASSVAFDKFWAVYPRKELKKKAREVWKRKKLDGMVDTVIAFVERAKSTDRWQKGFIKQPPAFLNGECWEDDLSAYGSAGGKSITFV